MTQPTDGYRRTQHNNSIAHQEEHDRAVTPPTTPPVARSQTTTPPMTASRERDDLIDSALAAAARNCSATQTGAAPPTAPKNDDVLYVGTNSTSVENEVNALRQAGNGRVEDVYVSKSCDIVNGGVGFNLTTAEGRHGFARSLHVDAETTARVESVLANSYESERSTLASIAVVFARGENGGQIPSRLVLSGHSGDGHSFGARGYSISTKGVMALGAAMPRAAKQIEDIVTSGCSSVVNPGIGRHEWIAAFPNVKTIWGYNGESPSPAGAHLAIWKQMTQGRKDNLQLTASLKEAHVAVWSARGGYQDAGIPLAVLTKRAAEADTRFEAYKSGARAVRNDSDPTLTRDFRNYAALSVHPGLSKSERDAFAAKADVLNRIRHYELVRRQFTEKYAAQVEQGYAALNLRAPDFAMLTRSEAMNEIASTLKKIDASPPPLSPSVKNLREKLAKLAALQNDPDFIEQQWVDE